jgi:hypothetical protein
LIDAISELLHLDRRLGVWFSEWSRHRYTWLMDASEAVCDGELCYTKERAIGRVSGRDHNKGPNIKRVFFPGRDRAIGLQHWGFLLHQEGVSYGAL